MKRSRYVASFAGAGAIALASLASAQTAQGPASNRRATTEPPTSLTQLQEVTVTGSRTIKNGNDSPSPVTVIPTDQLRTALPGMSLSQSLNVLPQFAGSRGAMSNPTTTGPLAGGNGAANQLNLRNLGPNRTLVLMDGKRVPPTLFNGTVDVDIIPQALVQRVDIVTGGVSAVYGSDAIAGVVNYVIDHSLQGFKGDLSSGISRYGDDPTADVSLAYGTGLGDSTHVEFSYEHHYEGGIPRRSDRSWLAQDGITGRGTTANPYILQTGLRQSGYPFGGLITTGALAGMVFDTNGALTPFTPGTPTGTAGIQIGGDGGYWDSSLIAKQSFDQIFGRIDHVFGRMSAYAQISGDLKSDVNDAEYAQLSGTTFSSTNAFLPASIQALIPASQTTFKMSRFLADIPRAEATARSNQWIFSGGMAGNGGGVDWNVDYEHAISKLRTDLANNLDRQKLGYALDAVSSNGQIVCNVTLTNPGLADGCVPFDAFGPTAASQAAIAYVTDTTRYNATTTMDDISAQASASPFSTWAGKVNTALSGDWRRLSFDSTSSSTPQDLVDCTGIRFGNCKVGGTLNDFSFGQDPGGLSQTVREIAGEFNAPLLSRSRLAGSFDLNGAVRYTTYNTSGSYWTWKVGGDWRVTHTLRFRATRSRDIRAPTLYELFAPPQVVQVRYVDLLTNTSATVPQETLSNPDLKAEIGNTLTVGAVWNPLQRLSVAVDAYKIKVSNAITSITGYTAAYQQQCYQSGGSSPYCTLQVRPGGFTDTSPANAVQEWKINYVNISEIETSGVDLEANYAARLHKRPLSLRLLATYQPHYYYRVPGVPTIDEAGAAFGPSGWGALPTLRLAAFLRYQPISRFTIDILERWRNAMKMSGNPAQVFLNGRVAPFATTSLTLAWDVPADSGNLQFFMNIDNLFDAIPPLGAYSGNGTRAGLRDGFAIGDDPRGRYFTIGVKGRF